VSANVVKTSDGSGIGAGTCPIELQLLGVRNPSYEISKTNRVQVRSVRKQPGTETELTVDIHVASEHTCNDITNANVSNLETDTTQCTARNAQTTCSERPTKQKSREQLLHGLFFRRMTNCS